MRSVRLLPSVGVFGLLLIASPSFAQKDEKPDPIYRAEVCSEVTGTFVDEIRRAAKAREEPVVRHCFERHHRARSNPSA